MAFYKRIPQDDYKKKKNAVRRRFLFALMGLKKLEMNVAPPKEFGPPKL